MANISAGSIRKGMYIIYKGEPCLVTKTDFMSPGKGSAVMRVRYKSIKTGTTQEFTHKSNETVEEVEVNSIEMQFLYADDTEAVFMDNRTFEQVGVPLPMVEDALELLTSDASVYVLLYEEKAIGVRLPPKVTLKVTYAEDATGGNTVGQAKKNAELETGAKILVPVFVKTGDSIIVDTDTKTYVSRAN